jgi:hypothetical protein
MPTRSPGPLLLLATLLFACRAQQSVPRPPSRALTAESSRTATAESAKAALPATPAAVVAQNDSELPVDYYPDGFYMPRPNIEINGYVLERISLPVVLTLSHLGNAVDYDCVDHITRDSVNLECPKTPIGTVRFAGAFTDLIHNWQNRNLNDSAIVVGRLTAEIEGTLISRQLRLFFWLGD